GFLFDRQGRPVLGCSCIEKEMTPTREQKAKALSDEIHKLGGWVVSMPGAAVMRFQFLNDARCEPALQRLREGGFEPTGCKAGLRFTPQGAEPCYTYELHLPPERQAVVDDRPKGQIVDRAEEARIKREIELMREAIYGKRYR